MKIEIDFSIFDSPVSAYGNVTGQVSVYGAPEIGSYIDFIGSAGRIIADGFSGALRVDHITPVPSVGSVIYGLEDVVVPSPNVAKELGRRLSDEMDLFVVDYDRPA
ncbi:hypothetical protein ACFONN_02265 [Dyella humi]|uniref:Uncharacterized protein n=1 Tax=Dyella humi TaxID=1770547 RepID=A0ABW8IFL1_9GAMM